MPSHCPSADRLAALLKDDLLQNERRLIEAHLYECSACREKLNTAAGGVGTGDSALVPGGDEPWSNVASAQDSSEVEALLARLKPEKDGERIGPYKLLQEIGEGGFGTVWMAEQTEPVKRRVALKIIKIGMDTKEVIARFEQERQALAMMDHPNIAKVFDAGGTQWGRPFFVMELVRGVPITDYCDHQKLPVRERLALFINVCQAVQHAHQKGIIHRDLKPSNILISMGDDHGPVPKIIDFGVAKAMDRTLTDKTLFTQFEQMIGTPTYMSPEQAGVGPMDIDTRSDIYSLGVLLYELLTGKPPFDPDKLYKAGHDEMRRVIREEEPPRPSTRLSTLKGVELTAVATRRHVDAAKLASMVRGDLDWIVMKALDKNRNRRYETANGLAMDLKRHLDNEPVLARPPSFAYKTDKFIRKYKAPVAATTAVLVALISGMATSTVLYLGKKAAWASEAEQRVVAESHAQAESREHQRAEASAMESKDRLVRLHVANGTRLFREGDTLGSLPSFAQALSLDREEPDKAFVHRMRLQSVIKQCPTLLQMWFHKEQVNQAVFSKDGRLVATGSADGIARVWDTTNGMSVSPELQHSARVESLCFSPDGSRVLTAARTHACLWKVATGGVEFVLNHELVCDAAFTPDGKSIASASLDGTVKIWSAQNGRETVPMLRHTDRRFAQQNPQHLAFSPDGRRLVTAAYDNHAQVWDVETGEHVLKLPHNHTVRHAEFSPDGTLMATANWAGTAHIWDAATGRELYWLPVQSGMVDHVTFSPSGKWMVSSGLDGKVRFWEARTGRLVRTLNTGEGLVLESEFSPNGNLLMTRRLDGRIHVWSVRDGTLAAPVLRHSWWATSAQFHPDGRRILTASIDGSVRLWDLQPEGSQFWPLPEAGSSALGWSPGRTRLLAESDSGKVQVWDVQSWQPLPLAVSFPNDIVRGFFSHDDSRLLTIQNSLAAAADNGWAWEVKLWDLQSGTLLHGGRIPFEGTPVEPPPVVVSADGTRLAFVSERTVEAWNVKTAKRLWRSERQARKVGLLNFSPDASQVVFNSGNVLHVLNAETGSRLYEDLASRMTLHAAVFRPDGQRLVTVDRDDSYDDGEARIWDVGSGRLVRALPHSDGVICAAFSDDNRLLATGGESKEARVFEVESGKPVSARMMQDGTVYSIAFSPDGRFLATGTDSRTSRVWEVATGEPVTPPLSHADEVAEVFFVAGGRILVTRCTGRYRFWRLQSDEISVEDLQAYAQLLAAHRLDATGVMEPLEPETVRNAWSRHHQLLGKDVAPVSTPAARVPGLPDEALKIREGILVLQRKLNGLTHPLTRSAMESLAGSYRDAGVWDKALPLMAEVSAGRPEDTIFALNVAILQAWFGKSPDHAVNCRRILDLANGTEDPSTADRAAKGYCLLPSSDPRMLEAALTLARRAVDLGNGHIFMPYFHMSLGMAEYRHGNYAAANQALLAAEQAGNAHRHVREAVRFFHAMSLFQQGKVPEAREIFAEAEAQMKPLPADEHQPLADGAASDDIVIWLASKEAKALLGEK